MDRTGEFSKADIDENKGIAWLSYLGILFVIPFLSDSEYARFHGRQGLVLFVNELIMLIVILVCHTLASNNILPWAFFPLRIAFLLVFYIGMGFYVCYGLINSIKGRAKELPIIGKMAK